MAKKSKPRTQTLRSRPQPTQRAGAPRPWPRKAVLGGIILALVLGVGGGVRWWQQRNLSPRLQGPVAKHYTIGPASAPVIIKEFSDYTCPHCKSLQEPLERAMQQFEGKVLLVFHPFVLNPTSEVATQAAWCAGEQGKFWEFHHMLYRRQELWSNLAAPLERLRAFAQDVQGVDTAALKSCVESGRMQARIHADTMYGQQLQVSSTPTMFINETRVVGTRSEGELVALIRQELDRVQRTSQ
jgi:protein-disulfide isomerase